MDPFVRYEYHFWHCFQPLCHSLNFRRFSSVESFSYISVNEIVNLTTFAEKLSMCFCLRIGNTARLLLRNLWKCNMYINIFALHLVSQTTVLCQLRYRPKARPKARPNVLKKLPSNVLLCLQVPPAQGPAPGGPRGHRGHPGEQERRRAAVDWWATSAYVPVEWRPRWVLQTWAKLRQIPLKASTYGRFQTFPKTTSEMPGSPLIIFFATIFFNLADPTVPPNKKT